MQNSRRVSNGRNRGGFTLIELLVVVLILSILMSIALPLYLSAVGDSEKTCRSNLQTIANTVQAARVKSLEVNYGLLIAGGVNLANLPDLNSLPLCPDGGTYSLLAGSSGDDTTFKVKCSIDSHGTFEPGVDNN